jgi:hypothetical protein
MSSWFQVLRWQGDESSVRPAKRAQGSSIDSSEEQPAKPRFELELQDASELEAARLC